MSLGVKLMYNVINPNEIDYSSEEEKAIKAQNFFEQNWKEVEHYKDQSKEISILGDEGKWH